MAYWKEVRAQAWAETRELVRLDNMGRIVMWLALAIAPALITWLALGSPGSAVDPLVRALASIGTTAVLALLFYAAKLTSVPPRREVKLLLLHGEALSAAEKTADELRASLASSAKQVPPGFQPYNNNIWMGSVVVAVSAGTPYLDKDGTLVFPQLTLKSPVDKVGAYRFNAERLAFIDHGGMASSQSAGQPWGGVMHAARFRIVGSHPVYVDLTPR